MKGRFWILVAVVIVWLVLLFLAYYPQWQLGGEALGLFEYTQEGDTAPNRVRLIQYFLVSLAVGLIVWRVTVDRGGRVE